MTSRPAHAALYTNVSLAYLFDHSRSHRTGDYKPVALEDQYVRIQLTVRPLTASTALVLHFWYSRTDGHPVLMAFSSSCYTVALLVAC